MSYRQPSSQSNWVLITALIVVLAGAGLFYFHVPSNWAISGTQDSHFDVLSTANVRSQPVGLGGQIVGQLKAGDEISGTLENSAAGQPWLKISEGKYAGQYVWAKLLRKIEKPDDSSTVQNAAQQPPVSQPQAVAETDTTIPANAVLKIRCFSGPYEIGVAQCFVGDPSGTGYVEIQTADGVTRLDGTEMVSFTDFERDLGNRFKVTIRRPFGGPMTTLVIYVSNYGKKIFQQQLTGGGTSISFDSSELLLK